MIDMVKIIIVLLILAIGGMHYLSVTDPNAAAFARSIGVTRNNGL